MLLSHRKAKNESKPTLFRAKFIWEFAGGDISGRTQTNQEQVETHTCH